MAFEVNTQNVIHALFTILMYVSTDYLLHRTLTKYSLFNVEHIVFQLDFCIAFCGHSMTRYPEILTGPALQIQSVTAYQ